METLVDVTPTLFDPFMIPQLTIVLQAAFLLIGLTKFIDLAWDKDYRSASKIAVCVIAGALLGMMIDGLEVLPTALIGLQASGLVTFAQALGGKKAQATAVVENPQG